jgi:hypothetical protein
MTGFSWGGGRYIWYEEDCAAAIVEYERPEIFVDYYSPWSKRLKTAEDIKRNAFDTVDFWCDRYASLSGEFKKCEKCGQVAANFKHQWLGTHPRDYCDGMEEYIKQRREELKKYLDEYSAVS